jgi:hypothetical protein
LREQLFLLFKFAVKQEWIATNPVEQADEVEHKGEGFYPWTEEDIATFRECLSARHEAEAGDGADPVDRRSQG